MDTVDLRARSRRAVEQVHVPIFDFRHRNDIRPRDDAVSVQSIERYAS